MFALMGPGYHNLQSCRLPVFLNQSVDGRQTLAASLGIHQIISWIPPPCGGADYSDLCYRTRPRSKHRDRLMASHQPVLEKVNSLKFGLKHQQTCFLHGLLGQTEKHFLDYLAVRANISVGKEGQDNSIWKLFLEICNFSQIPVRLNNVSSLTPFFLQVRWQSVLQH